MDSPPTEPVPGIAARVATGPRRLAGVWRSNRYLYDTVGADYVWWLRRTVPAAELAALLAHPQVSLHVLYNGGEPAGFFELDGRGWPDVNLSYFGLMPAIGRYRRGAGIPRPSRRRGLGSPSARHDGEHLAPPITNLRAAHLPARRLPPGPPGPGDMERSSAVRVEDPRRLEGLNLSVRRGPRHRCLIIPSRFDADPFYGMARVGPPMSFRDCD